VKLNRNGCGVGKEVVTFIRSAVNASRENNQNRAKSRASRQ
jgi:hypothetical protein